MYKEGIHISCSVSSGQTVPEPHFGKDIYKEIRVAIQSTTPLEHLLGHHCTRQWAYHRGPEYPESLFSRHSTSIPATAHNIVPGIQGVWWRVDCIAGCEKLYPSQVKCGMMWCQEAASTSLCHTGSESTGNPEALDGAVLGTFLHRHTQHRQGETSQYLFPKTQS